MKTVKQIADELGVSKQAVHKRMKQEPLSTNLKELMTTVDGRLIISVDGEMLIKQAFSHNTASIKLTTVDDNQIDAASTVDTLISMLQSELNIKNEQIKDLNERLSESNAALVAAQQSLQAAQVLHVGTMQKQLIDGRADQPVADAPIGFFSRVFGRKR